MSSNPKGTPMLQRNCMRLLFPTFLLQTFLMVYVMENVFMILLNYLYSICFRRAQKNSTMCLWLTLLILIEFIITYWSRVSFTKYTFFLSEYIDWQMPLHVNNNNQKFNTQLGAYDRTLDWFISQKCSLSRIICIQLNKKVLAIKRKKLNHELIIWCFF